MYVVGVLHTKSVLNEMFNSVFNKDTLPCMYHSTNSIFYDIFNFT